METKSAPLTNTPPHLIQAIITGFNIVTQHIYLILFPLALDLMLWFGPHLRVKNLLQPFLKDIFTTMMSMAQPEIQDMIKAGQKIWEESVDRFNLFSLLRGFPVGVPSLFAAEGPLKTPLGLAPLIESPSAQAAASAWIAIALVGLLFGSCYFYLIARYASNDMRPVNLGTLGLATWQSLLLFIMLAVLLMLIGFPILLFMSVMAMISMDLAQIAFILLAISILWVLMPLVFSPHGIFTFQLDALRSALVSYRLVRPFLPGASLFLTVSILISQGLDSLWRVPPENSWMVLVGLFGHAMISTSLITASFTYYISGMKWMQENINGQKPVVRGQ